MSLINQLLKDLEKKPYRNTSREGLLAGLRADISGELKKKKNYYTIITLLVFILLFIVSLSLFAEKHDHNTSATAKNTAPLSNTTLSQITPQKNTAPAIANGNAMLTGIALQMQQDMTYLRFLLSHNTLYEINSDKRLHELTIIFENTRLVAALPRMNYSGSGIENIQAFKDDNGNLKIVLHLSPTTDIKHLGYNEDEKAPELQLDMYYNNSIEALDNHQTIPHTIPITIKKPIFENNAEQAYQHAQQLATTGQNNEAVSALKNLLITSPGNIKARIYLTTLLVQQGKPAEAIKVIDTGLKLQPDNTALLKFKARILVEEGAASAAIALLEKVKPQMDSDPEYYAFIAALYQRQGQANLAANLYKQLVALQPTNAKWWVGLGIASEATGDQNQAIDAYTSAENIGGLDPELKSYLMTRLHTT